MISVPTVISDPETTTASMSTILIAEDHTIVRSGLRALLESANLKVAGEAPDGVAAVEQVAANPPDVVLLDVAMPRLNGIEAARAILQHNPQQKIIILSMHADEQY